MHYEVEVNIGRKGGPPAWTPMIENENDGVAIWTDLLTLRAEASDQGWEGYRVVTVADDESRTAVS